MTKPVNPSDFTVFDYNPRTRRFEERRGPRGSSYADRARDRDFGSRGRLADEYGKNLPSGGYSGGSRSSRVMRAARKIGLGAARLNPVGRAINTAFDAAQSFKPEWAWQVPAQEAGYEFPPGGTACCSNGPSGRNSVQWVAGSKCPSINLCGITGQVPNMIEGTYTANGNSEMPTKGLWLLMGPGGWISEELRLGRYTVGEVQFYPGPVELPVYRQARDRAALRLPASAPPTPAISETLTPRPNLARREKPYQAPALQFEPGVAPSFTPHNRLPARVGVRERKANVSRSGALALIAALYDATTEAKDIVDILYDNLGTQCKGAKSLSEKSYCVYKNFGTLKVGMALLELAKNHYEDKVYGKIFGTVGKHTGFGSMLPGTGPSRDPGPIRNLSSRS